MKYFKVNLTKRKFWEIFMTKSKNIFRISKIINKYNAKECDPIDFKK